MEMGRCLEMGRGCAPASSERGPGGNLQLRHLHTDLLFPTHGGEGRKKSSFSSALPAISSK